MHNQSVSTPLPSHDHFAELFAQYQRRIYSYISTLIINRDDVDDIFQQTCVVLWKKWNQYDPQADFANWGCGIARNEVRNYLRKKHGSSIQFSDQVLDSLSDEHIEVGREMEARHRALSDCLDKLPPPQRELVERCYSDEGSIRSIANRMQIAPTTLYMKLHRLRRALLDCISLALRSEP
ncbi:MAG: sigma-70 family RNA polymerase sigma factor [Pirellulales bacterium]|nr:sigma-70 family RNA polymerase sigma factor [Pirellulales bacterium]